MDWQTALKIALSVGFSFGSGWATAILSDVTPTKALASGVVAAAAYWLGKQQDPGLTKK
jgi:hypothetical protein